MRSGRWAAARAENGGRNAIVRQASTGAGGSAIGTSERPTYYGCPTPLSRPQGFKNRGSTPKLASSGLKYLPHDGRFGTLPRVPIKLRPR